MIPVLLDIGGIDYQKICLTVYTICQEIIHDASFSVREAVILNLTGI